MNDEVKKPVRRRGRPPKFDKILTALRADILSGKFQPGDKLPTREELATLFSSTKVTMQKAIDVLLEEGILSARRGAGTYVTGAAKSKLPLFMILEEEEIGDSRFNEALELEAKRLSENNQLVTVCTYVRGNYKTAELQRLIGLMSEQRVAGILFQSNWAAIKNTPMAQSPKTPKVFIATRDYPEDAPHVSYEGQVAIYSRVLDYYKEQGCKTAALIRSFDRDHQMLKEPFARMAAERGITVPDVWVQPVPRGMPAAAGRVAELLFRNKEDIPDAVHITDDNMVPSITKVLSESGISIPDDLKVTGHANFPYPTSSHVKMRRIGYDTRQFVKKGLDAISVLRQGHHPANSVVPGIWEEEVPQTPEK